jgi:hypothetical protein
VAVARAQNFKLSHGFASAFCSFRVKFKFKVFFGTLTGSSSAVTVTDLTRRRLGIKLMTWAGLRSESESPLSPQARSVPVTIVALNSDRHWHGPQQP